MERMLSVADGRTLYAHVTEAFDAAIASMQNADDFGGYIRVRLQGRDGGLESIRSEMTDEEAPFPWVTRQARDEARLALDSLARYKLVSVKRRARIAAWIQSSMYFSPDSVVLTTAVASGGVESEVPPLRARYVGGLATWPELGMEAWRSEQIREAANWLDDGEGRMPFASSLDRDRWVISLRGEGYVGESQIAAKLPYMAFTTAPTPGAVM